jgi:hypothetical protein
MWLVCQVAPTLENAEGLTEKYGPERALFILSLWLGGLLAFALIGLVTRMVWCRFSRETEFMGRALAKALDNGALSAMRANVEAILERQTLSDGTLKDITVSVEAATVRIEDLHAVTSRLGQRIGRVEKALKRHIEEQPA